MVALQQFNLKRSQLQVNELWDDGREQPEGFASEVAQCNLQNTKGSKFASVRRWRSLSGS